MFCGGDLLWDSDADACDLLCGYEEDDTAFVSYYHFTVCGRSYEICCPNKEERNSIYKNYWG